MIINYYLSFILLLHVCFINNLEKIYFQLFLNNKHVPKINCEKDNPINLQVKCLGMPSRYSELLVIILAYFLIKFRIKLDLQKILIISVIIFTLFSLNNTVKQNLVAILLGIIYSCLYINTNYSYKSCLISVSIMILYIVLIYNNIESLLNEPIPTWVDKSMYKKIEDKKNIIISKKFSQILICSLFPKDNIFIGWNQLEKYLDKTINKIQNKNIKFDSIVGIKTGGAIISDYISNKLNITNYKIKMSLSHNKCKSGMRTKDVMKTYILKKKNKYIMCEGIKDNIEGKNVILIDELISSGNTINNAINYLKEIKKVKNLYVITLICNDKFLLKHNINFDIIVPERTHYQVWPWGYDN